MVNLNPQFARLKRPYIFPIIEEKLKKKSSLSVLNFGIGDVALPLAKPLAQAIIKATEEMTTSPGIHGYPPSQGYPFLKQAIQKNQFAHLNITLDEIFISDGANSDAVNILELFARTARVAIMSPSYPAYLDACILRGHKPITFLPCLEENRFSPSLPNKPCDLIYLCTPNNPTGEALTRKELQAWVNYAREHQALLLIDAAYEAFITSPDVPRSIFEIEGSHECAIEFHSFSKSAGFTGLRCAYMVLPLAVKARFGSKSVDLNSFWLKRQSAKFNGVAYPIQRGAEAVFSKEGKAQTQAQIQSYLNQAKALKAGLKKLGFTCYGGIDSPYLFVKAPEEFSSWEFFDYLLEKFGILCIPGLGFGSLGEGFVRFSCFCTAETMKQALERLNS